MANGIEQQRLENRIDELTSLVRQLVVTQHQVQEPGQIYGVFPGKPQQQYNLYSNTYNPGWRDHPNLRWGNSSNQQGFQQQPYKQPQPPMQQVAQQPTLASGPSLEDLVKQLATNNLQFQQRTEASIQTLQTHIGQLDSSLSHIQSQGSNSLTSQTIPNPKSHVSAITLRSGKELQAQKHDVTDSIDKLEATYTTEPSSVHSAPIPLPFPNNLSDAMRYPSEEHSVFHLDTLDDTIDDMQDELLTELLQDKGNEFESTCSDCTSKHELCAACSEIAEFLNDKNGVFNYVCSDCAGKNDLCVVCSEIAMSLGDTENVKSIRCDNAVVQDCLQFAGSPTESVPTLTPSVQQPLDLELKPLPKHLGYAHLEDDKKLPVITFNQLDVDQEERLIQIIKKHKMNLEVIFGKFNDHGEMVEHDPSYHLIIVQPMKESFPPEPPPDFKIGVFIIFNLHALMLFSFLGFYMGLRQTPTQITVHQDYELPLSARNPLDPD